MQRPEALTADERAQRDRLDERYGWACAPIMLEIERSVCGCDYGGSSWTTRAEAERMAEDLQLGPGIRLLDLGAGSGWPGLYLAQVTGCRVTLADLPVAGLKIARDRAAADGIAERAGAVVADAAFLPFADDFFDALSHSDLLCCLVQKRAVLAACRQVLRGGGRMVFTVLYVSPGLSAGDYRKAVASGPEFVESDSDYPTLLSETGWSAVDTEDLTTALGASYRRQLDADLARQGELTALLGAAAYDERIAMWRGKGCAVEEGLLRRARFVVV